MQSAWREDILRRAEASMQRRHTGEEAEAARALLQRDVEIQRAREDFAWRVFFGIIAAGFVLALIIKWLWVQS